MALTASASKSWRRSMGDGQMPIAEPCIRRLSAKVGTFHTDQWAAYGKVLPKKKHEIGKAGTLRIERRNLTFRTRIKRLQRRRICFSKSEVMHDAVLNLHIHHLNPLHHQI